MGALGWSLLTARLRRSRWRVCFAAAKKKRDASNSYEEEMPFKGSVRETARRRASARMWRRLTRRAFLCRRKGAVAAVQLYWCAPEVMRNMPYTEKSDVYSFGIIMWEVLTRETLYPGLHPLSVGYKVRRWRSPC